MGPPWLDLLHYNLQAERKGTASERPRCGKKNPLAFLPHSPHPKGHLSPQSVSTLTCPTPVFAQDGQNDDHVEERENMATHQSSA